MAIPARSRRRTVLALAAVVAVAVSFAVATPASAAPAGTASDRIARQVDAALAAMTLPQKIGQLFVTYVYGDTATTEDPAYTSQNQALYGVDNGAQLIAEYHLGGIIYFAWTSNLQTPQQIGGLSNGLQHAAMAQQPAIPLIINTDQEGGNVVRIGAPAAVSPGEMATGATFSPIDAFRDAQASGQQLRAMGINVDNAPVVDVNTNPANTADGPRSFGDNPAMVSALTATSVLGFQLGAGEGATAKHFPGLGSTTVNTDTGIAVTDETRAQFERNDLPPFRAAIASGIDVIMAAHIVAPALDPSGAPASMSEPIVTGLLRGELHYNGVVTTDALSATALENIPSPQRAVDAIEAGDDELLMPDSLTDSFNAVLQAVQNGTISEARIDQSVRRILTLKYKLGLFTDPYVDTSQIASRVGTPAQLATMAGVARHSITLVRNEDHTLPLANGSGEHVLVTGWGSSSTQTLANDIAAHGVTTQLVYTGGSPSSALIAAAVAAAKQNDIVVVTTNSAWGDPGQQQLVHALIATGKPVIAVALATPYDVAYFPSVPAFIGAYGYQPNTLQSVADVLFGANPTGHLPVTVPVAGNPAQPLYPWGWGLSYRR